MINRKSILLDCERMKYPYTGLYYYCLHLYNNLQLTNTNEKNICVYSPKKAVPVFNNACIVEQKPIHKMLLPPTGRFDIWHSTYQGTNYYPWRRKIKVVLTVHDLNFLYDDSKTPEKKDKYLTQLKNKVQRADHIVAISNYVLNDLKTNLNIENKDCSVVYNGCNINEIKQLQPPAIIPQEPYLFTIGTVVDKKNFHVLPALLAKNNMQLVIAGITQSEAYKNKVIAEAKKWGVENRVIFTGSISENDKQWYLKHCAAFLFPSVSEGFGLPVIEAMYFGKPCILSTYTCLPEIGGDAAYYFQNFEPEHMQQVLQDSLQHFNEQQSSLVKQRADSFSWQKSAQQYHHIYNSLLGL